MALLPNKNLLIFNRNRPCQTNGPEFEMWEIPYSSGAYDGDPIDRTPAKELFCAGHVHLPDGKLFLAGGNEHHDYQGLADTFIYDFSDGSLTEKRDMWERRWYPTCILLPNGRVLIFEGTIDLEEEWTDPCDPPDTFTPIFNHKPTMWFDGVPSYTTSDYQATLAEHALDYFYPHVFVNPLDGNLFYTGRGVSSGVHNESLNLVTLAWNTNVYPYATDGVGNKINVKNVYPSAVMMIRATETGVDKAMVIKSGGGDGLDSDEASSETVRIDLAASSPAWEDCDNMVWERKNHTLVALPNGYVIAMGGARDGQDDGGSPDRTAPEWRSAFGAAGEDWSLLAYPPDSPSDQRYPRGYHSTALLLPDGLVIIAGGEPQNSNQNKAQIFAPPYAGMDIEDWEELRPSFDGTPPSELRYGEDANFDYLCQVNRAMDKVVLISIGATTHAFNQSQRYVELEWDEVDNDTIAIHPPANPNIAPPGVYMLFLHDKKTLGGNDGGIPSVAHFVTLRDFDRVLVADGDGQVNFGSALLPPAYGRKLWLNENDYLGNGISSEDDEGTQAVEIEVWGHYSDTSASKIRLTVESLTTKDTTLSVSLYHWANQDYDPIGSDDLTANLEARKVFTSSSGTPYIRSTDQRIKAMLRWSRSDSFTAKADLFEIGVR